MMNPGFESPQSIEEKVKKLADRIANFLTQDELGSSCEEKIAQELVILLKNAPKKEQERLLEFYAVEAIKSYGNGLPSVAEDVRTAVNIARRLLENTNSN